MAKKSKSMDIHHPNMVKTVFILVSIAIVCFLVIIVKYTSFKSDPRASTSNQKIVYKITRDNNICKKTYSNRLYAQCPFSIFGNSCGTKYTLNGKIYTVKSNTPCGTVMPSWGKKWLNKYLNLQLPQPSTLYCCVSEN